MNFVKQLENAPKNLVLYTLGLIGAVVDDYALITLAIFCVLLGFVLDAVLIPLTAFFGAYFVMRIAVNLVESILLLANATASGARNQAQATMQVAAALAQSHPPDQADPDRHAIS